MIFDPPTPNERTTRALINELTTNGGCTLTNGGEHATKGYAVGLGGAKALDPKRSYFVQVLRIVKAARLEDPATAFGAWHDSDSGLDYVEPVQIYNTRGVAEYVAAERGELAIYDLTNCEEIRIDASKALATEFYVPSKKTK